MFLSAYVVSNSVTECFPYCINRVNRVINNYLFIHFSAKALNGPLSEKTGISVVCSKETVPKFPLAATRHVDAQQPNGILLFLSNQYTHEYNAKTAAAYEGIAETHAMNNITGHCSTEGYAAAKAMVEMLRKVDTGSLSAKLALCIGHLYVFVPNIEVTDGLANRSVGKIPFVQHNIHSQVLQLWLEFPDGRVDIVARSKGCHLRMPESEILPT